MDNHAIADQLQLLSKLMDIHGEDTFKAKSYASAAYTIKQLPEQISGMPQQSIFKLKGVGESVGKKIVEILENGESDALKNLVAQTPEGIFEMMSIKDLGPKKINVLWKELNISDIDELKEACQQNKIALKKGFGEKTQQNILEAIQFQIQSTGTYLYVQLENVADALKMKLENNFPEEKLHITGAFRRQLEVIEELEWVTTIPIKNLKKFFKEETSAVISESSETIMFVLNEVLKCKFYVTDDKNFYKKLLTTTCSNEFLLAYQQLMEKNGQSLFKSEEEIFVSTGLPYIPPFLREKPSVLTRYKKNEVVDVIDTHQIKGLIHAHSNWSDGSHTIEKMATELIQMGFEYLVISDHSKAAHYAGGLSEQRIKEQHRYIDELNEKLSPFKIYKSIECDILNDGAMDYPDEFLAIFDLLIASIHSNLQMNEQKAMKRLLGAINNPYVTILGHLTGRKLLKRKGYPVDHKTIIEACAENHVAIEINANPLRLDITWEWMDIALENNIMLSINPDAHSISEFHNIKYGVLVAQKGGLTKEKNLSSFSKKEFDNYLEQTKRLRGTI
ncbi:MAG: helix-hairpin-helix domain-containing protein [Chitinophagaceae bacterium]